VTRFKLGIIGCGAIAQIQYLPILRDLQDQFEIGGLSDLSQELLTVVGEQYGVPRERRFRDYHDLLNSDIDAVVVCPFGSHAPASIAAAHAGKHVLVEKPMCTTVNEAEEMVSAAEAAGTILMVAYMKRYDPAFLFARARIGEMSDVRFIQVNHLHPDNSLHIARFNIHRAQDLPPAIREKAADEQSGLVAKALGFSSGDEVPPYIRRAYSSVLGSMIHDIGNLHGIFGPPSQVRSTDIWSDGRGITTNLEYADGKRAVCTWVDLPELFEFKETLEAYGSRERVIVSFPTGFSVGLPSTVYEHGMELDHTPWRKELSWYENPFKLELQHFRDCVRTGRRPNTEGKSAIHDIALVRDIVLAHLATSAQRTS
jgi:predicted dehydrogenase